MSYAALNAYADQGSAVSSDALNLVRVAKAVVKSAEDSQALFGRKGSAISTLNRLAIEAALPDWDGYGSTGINVLAQQNAANFIRALPEFIPMPEFAIEPDGSISLDWIVSRYRMFSLSIGTSDRIAFAWLDGSDSGYAVSRFDQQSIPARILDGLRLTLRDERPSFWAA